MNKFSSYVDRIETNAMIPIILKWFNVPVQGSSQNNTIYF